MQARPATNLPLLTHTIALAFSPLPFPRAVISEKDSLPSHTPIPLSRYIQHFSPWLQSAATAHDAHLVEAGDYSAVALWEGPEFERPQELQEEDASFGAVRKEFRRRAEEVRRKWIGEGGFWHLVILARGEGRKGDGGRKLSLHCHVLHDGDVLRY